MPSSHPVKAGDHVFLVDGSSFIFRAYFQSIRQDPKYNFRSDRLPTGAVRIFATKILQFVRDGAMGIKPTHLAIIFDKSENSFRKALYPLYKANRSDPPEDLVPQFPLMREVVRAFGLQPVEQDTYEADDLIATYATQARAAGADVLIISADKDLMQLIEPGVFMYDPASGERDERRIGEAEVRDYFGVGPQQVVDVQALAGDSTDNVPGAKGIGLKTAAQLITQYGSLDTLLEKAHEIPQPKRREALTDPEAVSLIRISEKLVRLVRDVPLVTPLAELGLVEADPTKLVGFLKAMEFTTITRRVADLYGVDPAAIDANPNLSKSVTALQEHAGQSPDPSHAPNQGSAVEAGQDGLDPHQAVRHIRAKLENLPFTHANYATVQTIEALKDWIARARQSGFVAFDTETSGLDAMAADLIGVSLAIAPNEACYVPLGHIGEGSGDLFGGGALLAGQIPQSEALALLKPLLEDPTVLKIGQNIKFDQLVMRQHGVDIIGVDDTMLMSYALDAGLHGHGMDEMAELFFGHKPIAFAEVAGSGKTFIGFARVTLDRATAYAAEDADITLRLWMLLRARLNAEGMISVYERLERPLAGVLARMEERGIAIDRAILSRLSGEFAQSMARLEEEVHQLAGEAFNLGSPKQLGDILFGKLGLPGAKKTATGAWSTGAQVLEELAEQGHELPRRLLDWRQLAKLKSTYTDALPTFVNARTGRVHTSFSMAATTTGRLSSSDPNIQNIPVRSEEGRRIRKAFVATQGHKLISADYSQIELRLLAHIADIPQLRQAFENGIDIHAMTASEMFGVPVAGMDPMIRRRAKAINFGIIYGISAFGLANQLGIPREEASAYIKQYFERFPGIRDYMDMIKREVREKGFVTTIFGRKAHYPQIKSSNPSERAFMERAAINAPIQGSAADVIRRAMIRMEEALALAGLSARMLLQVHDELIFEVPHAEVEASIPVIKSVMEQAASPAVTLHVPLSVDARAADNWDEAH
jgi:DNA polymerase-1